MAGTIYYASGKGFYLSEETGTDDKSIVTRSFALSHGCNSCACDNCTCGYSCQSCNCSGCSCSSGGNGGCNCGGSAK